MEIQGYIEACEEYEKGKKLEEVYVTDHKAPTPNYLTGNEEEDEECRAYEESLAEYNAAGSAGGDSSHDGKYKRGSLLQRIMDPFAGAPKDSDGAIVYTVTDEELEGFNLDDLEVIQKKYLEAVKAAEVSDLDPEDEDAWRELVVEELGQERNEAKLAEFHAVLDKELAVFEKGE